MALPSVNPAADAEMSSARAPLARVMAPLAWAAGTVALSHVPAAAHALPALGVLRGPLGGVLVAVAIVVAAAVLLPPLRLPRVSSAALVAVACTFLVAVRPAYTIRP